jgi:hypothetical protein
LQESWEDEFDEKPKEASKAKPPQPAAADKTPAEPKKQTLKDKIAQKEAATKKKTVKKASKRIPPHVLSSPTYSVSLS